MYGTEGKNPSGDTGRPSAKTGDGTVSKALWLLDHIGDSERPKRFSALLAETGLPKATLHRMLRSLLDEGALGFDEYTSSYTLGPRLLRLAHRAWLQNGFLVAAGPVLDELSREIGETLHLAQLERGQVLYLDKRTTAHAVTMYSATGKIAPAFCTGIGKAMLSVLNEAQLSEAVSAQSFRRYTDTTLDTEQALRADLAFARERGYAIDNEEHETGISCVAVPVISEKGALYGGLSVTSAVFRMPLENLVRHAPLLKSAAARIAGQAEIRMAPAIKVT